MRWVGDRCGGQVVDSEQGGWGDMGTRERDWWWDRWVGQFKAGEMRGQRMTGETSDGDIWGYRGAGLGDR